MKPVKFEQMNYTFKAPEQYPDCPDIPVRKDHKHGVITSCWKMTWKERWQLLFSGRIWLMTYYHSHPPVQMHTKRNLFKKKK